MTRPSMHLFGTAVAGLGLLAAPLAVSAPATAEEAGRDSDRTKRRPTVVQVDASKRLGKVQPLLGINHRYPQNGFGLWDVRGPGDRDDRPDPTVVSHMRRAGVQSLRYPGGTTATMYKWKDAIGRSTDRACQIEGHGNRIDGFKPLTDKLSYGPDEYMEVIDATGARSLIMMPFVTQGPRDAADWVEYMNAKVGTNPNGGVPWAKRRADPAIGDHPRPYNVTRWEIGNESHVAPQRYDFSPNIYEAVDQYANGGVREIEAETLGRNCHHPGDGKPATGKRHQVFETIHTPVTSFGEVRVNGRKPWTRVPQRRLDDPAAHGLEGKRVYAVEQERGRVIFGTAVPRSDVRPEDRTAVPEKGDIVSADYTNRYRGFFAFARAMHEVDPDIKVCATWGGPLFADRYGRRDYDCSSAHPITNFSKPPVKLWKSSLEGHDRMMLGLAGSRDHVQAILDNQPARTPLWLTEFQPIHGFGAKGAFPGWSASMSNTVYMSSQWATWLKMGIPWGNGGDLLGRGVGSVFGSPQEYAFSTEAHARQAMLPMFSGGGEVLRTGVLRNPVRDPGLRNAGSYGALTVAATRSRDGSLHLLVVNRLPNKDVKATVRTKGFRAKGSAYIRRVAGRSYAQWNRPGEPGLVRMERNKRTVGREGFTATFPAHSVSTFRVPRQPRR